MENVVETLVAEPKQSTHRCWVGSQDFERT